MNTSITAARIATRARTWLLMAGLTGLLVGIGAAVGGGGLYLFAAIAVAMNAAGYWFSDKIALTASRAQPLAAGTIPWLDDTVRDLAGRAELPTPRVYVVPSEQPNAFATGRNPQHAAIAVTEGLVRDLPQAQVRGVLAHEFGHIKNRDILVSSIAAMVAGAISAIANILSFTFLFGGNEDEDGATGLIRTIATIVFAPLAAMLIQLGVTRQREYLADATGAQVLGQPEPLIAALETLERGAQAQPMAVNPATASLYSVNPLPRAGMATLFMTHPPIQRRIARLRALAREATIQAA